jgi:hypothetical protein
MHHMMQHLCHTRRATLQGTDCSAECALFSCVGQGSLTDLHQIQTAQQLLGRAVQGVKRCMTASQVQQDARQSAQQPH